jgi:hypothetical protein
MPSENELAGARFQGRHVTQIAASSKGRRRPRTPENIANGIRSDVLVCIVISLEPI